MAQILVRNVENSVKAKLQRRAKRNGRSMEAEVREILRDATKEEIAIRKGLGSRIASHFAKFGLQKGEEIPELRGFRIETPDFRE
jgi:antitoxin FitA